MPPTVDHRLLRLLCAVVETRSVSRAATALGITQPTASYLLGRLRGHLRDPMFLKSHGAMRPTAKTLALYGEIRKGLDILDAAFDPLSFDPASSDRRFRIALIDIGELVFLPPILRRLAKAGPNITIESVPVALESIPAALDLGDIDFSIGNTPDICAGTAHRTVFRDHYVAVMRSGHPKISARLTRRLLERLDRVTVASPYTGQRTMEHALAEYGIWRKPKLTIANYTSVGDVIAQTDFIVIAPSRVGRALAASHGLKSRELPVPVPAFSVRIHWSARHQGTAAHAWMRELLITTLSRL